MSPSVRQLKLRFSLQFFLLVSTTGAVAQDETSTTRQAPFSVKPPWLGLTPLYEAEAGISPETAKKAEDALVRGRRGFWYGLGGLLSSVLFDQIGLVVPRTLSYAVLGVGWSEWLGSYGEARFILEDSVQSGSLVAKNRFAKASTQGAIGESSNLF